MATAYECANLVMDEVKKVVTGKDECIKKALAAILAGGHILIEDVPGVGKTTLAVAFSNAMGLHNQRVQFTPDVMPSDFEEAESGYKAEVTDYAAHTWVEIYLDNIGWCLLK